ncbi:Predicted N-formylglutamate amidohydrolase [Altererythrobacter xiamenensis]|uniref:Predicted N-formylglutamate amidohydrolase n=1 Tax=Altererythrobacter xiamenensis TaxID=1316679 RepID=A0A1Y6FK05_9SPHN|nr:N-formylglutamate amidohydrolase [Altererythrobacter xiamenensis]SMQ74686.1 Predicted N-formylglutamate amidohydrolase [Altererythrobacter xiamenensis]
MILDDNPYRQVGEVKRGGIVCVADHASNFVPDDIDLGIPAELLNEHVALDIGVEGIAERLARRHGVAAHIACVSRLVCDLHREEDHPKVVPTESDGHLIPGNIGADIEKRLELYHRPYHEALGKWLDQIQPELIVSLHSFTPELATSDEERPWECALLYNEDDRAARHAIRLFSELGLNVGDNEPYSGKQLNATMNRHAEAHGRYYLALEIRQDLIATRAEQSRWAAMVADVAGRVLLALKAQA